MVIVHFRDGRRVEVPNAATVVEVPFALKPEAWLLGARPNIVPPRAIVCKDRGDRELAIFETAEILRYVFLSES